MAKSQKSGNKEAKKPKTAKVAVLPTTAGVIAKANVGAPGKKRG